MHFRLKEDGSGYQSTKLNDLLTSTHVAFRPIDVKIGPDGAIYIADWYNPIIQHGEVDFRDPRRDHVHGRIWRISHKERDLDLDAEVAECEGSGTVAVAEIARRFHAASRAIAVENARCGEGHCPRWRSGWRQLT